MSRFLILGLLLSACSSDAKLDRVNAAPVVSIDAPTDGEVFRQGDGLIAFVGTVADTYDTPADMLVTWSIDDGAPTDATPTEDGGVSLDLDSTALALGDHVATLMAIDSDDAVGSAELHFVIGGPLGAPTVVITAPEDGSSFLEGDSITFTGVGNDVSTAADDLVFTWSSDLDGPLTGAITGGGQSALLTSTLSTGTHIVTLGVTDTDGEVGSDTVTVTIGEDVVIPPEPGDLIFTEFMVNPEGVDDENGEWVELYNTSGSTLDIAGYSFHDDAADLWVFDASVRVAPHAYMVLCANPDPIYNGGVHCDGWFYRNPMGTSPTDGIGHGSGVALANNDDELELTSPSNVDIDIFDYNDTDSDPIQKAMSFGLDPSVLDGVANDDIDNWCVQTTMLPGADEPGTPGQANDSCGFGAR